MVDKREAIEFSLFDKYYLPLIQSIGSFFNVKCEFQMDDLQKLVVLLDEKTLSRVMHQVDFLNQ